MTRAAGKQLVAQIGLILAWIEHDTGPESGCAPNPTRLLLRSVHAARHVLDDYGEPPTRYEPLAGDVPAPESTERPDALPLHLERLDALHACATSAQQRALLHALEHGCATLAEVDRQHGWAHGHAAVTASRLRRKLPALL